MSKLGRLQDVAAVIGFLLLASLAYAIFARPFHVPSEAMVPTIEKDAHVFVKTMAYWRGGPQRGDLIVFERNGVKYVKRVVAIPGDKIQMREGVPHVNDQASTQTIEQKSSSPNGVEIQIVRERLFNGVSYRIELSNPASYWDSNLEMVVPEGGYYVLGDNRRNSLDSRQQNGACETLPCGFIQHGEILGRVWGVLGPNWSSFTVN